MRKMRYTRNIVVAALLLAVWLPARAQYKFAGPDKKVLRNGHHDQTVTIGEPGEKDACYEWMGNYVNHIVDEDKNKAVVTVRPTEDEEVYIVKKTDYCGVKYDRVKVTIVDTISLVSVTPTRCYNTGDTIEKVHFKIVTDPAGYESLVELKPFIARHDIGFANSEWEQTIQFTLKYNNHESKKKAKVKVMNEDLALNISFSPEFNDLEKKVLAAEKRLKEAKAIVQFGLKGFENAAPGVWKFKCDTFKWDRSYTVPTFNSYCCNGEKITAWHLASFSVSGSINCEWNFLIPSLGVPGVGGVYVVFEFGGGVTIGPLAIHWRKTCSEVTLPVEFVGTAAGGARAQAISKDFLSFSAKVEGTLRKALVWSIGEPVQWDKWKLSVALVGEARAFGLGSVNICFPIGAWSF